MCGAVIWYPEESSGTSVLGHYPPSSQRVLEDSLDRPIWMEEPQSRVFINGHIKALRIGWYWKLPFSSAVSISGGGVLLCLRWTEIAYQNDEDPFSLSDISLFSFFFFFLSLFAFLEGYSNPLYLFFDSLWSQFPRISIFWHFSR